MTWLCQWATDQGLQRALSRPGKPWEGSIGDECQQQIPRRVHWHNRAVAGRCGLNGEFLAALGQ